jgi:hypothetical protein
MKNLFLKFTLILSMLIGVSQIITAQNYTITDGGDYIKFRAGSAYAVSDISKDNIKTIEVASSTEVRIVTNVASGNTSFLVDISWKMSNDSTFTNVSNLETYLLNIWNKRYYHEYSYDANSNLIEHKQYWIFDSDTIEVSNLADTLIYDASDNLINVIAE